MKTENMKTVGAALLCTLAICTSPIGATADADKINAYGKKVPFLLFDKNEKMEYRDAVAKAKKNDAKAYYWLAYYFAAGGREGVAQDDSAAWRCLSKSASLGYPDAIYAKAVIHERSSFHSMYADDSYVDGFCSETPIYPDDRERYYSVNDDTAVAKVEELYNRAVAGGLTFATNDLTRFRKKVSAKRAEISAIKALTSEADDVLKALEQEEKAEEEAKRKAEEDAKKVAEDVKRRAEEEAEKMKAEEEAKRIAEEDAKRKVEDEERKKLEAEAAYWSSWPGSASIFDEEIRLACENEIGVVIDSGDTNHLWTAGSGKSLIFQTRGWGPHSLWQKCDETGRIIKSARSLAAFDERTWLTNRAAQVTTHRITDWATAHGMTHDEAVSKHNAFLSKYCNNTGTRGIGAVPSRRGLLGSRTAKTNEPSSLRERRALREQARAEERSAAEENARIAAEKEAQREAERAAEREQREREREEQRAQLMQIQEELRKAREERAK